MTQEDKDLLLKDLCSRLPYGVVVEIQLVNVPKAKYPVLKVLQSYMLCVFMQTVDNVIHKPYLRSMSSMTDEEHNVMRTYLHEQAMSGISSKSYYVVEEDNKKYWKDKNIAYFDWLNAHHFDYRGLIEKGLAIEVTEENNPYVM